MHCSSYILLVTQTTPRYVDGDSTGCENQEGGADMRGGILGTGDHSLKDSLLVPSSTQTSVGDRSWVQISLFENTKAYIQQ